MSNKFDRFRGLRGRNSFKKGGFSRGSKTQRHARPQRGKYIDPSLFVNQAKELSVENYVTKNSFSDFRFSDLLVKSINFKGYTSPTPIQDQAIAPIVSGRDIIGIANTGTGKTAAFLLPLIDKVYKDRTQKVFIVVPTRELALQINEEIKAFTYHMNIYSAILIGGAKINKQINDLRRNPNFVIGTPGRIKDILKRRAIDLSNFRNIVLDEVDMMVDIGFIKDVQYFVSLLSQNRQSLFFSATISPKVRIILDSFVKNPVSISVKTRDTAESINQDVIRVLDKDKKVDQLHQLLIQKGFDKVLVFGRTKWNVETLAKELNFRGFKVASIHGNKTQGQRQRAIQEFKSDKLQVLLATDVASRGLDINGVTHVINYDIPESYDDYVHRIGRTGRAGKTGQALTFI
ncbi:MAG: DEAD/DEAH box helicase [Patescibacteria group bacterium]